MDCELEILRQKLEDLRAEERRRLEEVKVQKDLIILKRALSHGVSFEVMEKVVAEEDKKWNDYFEKLWQTK